MQPKSKSTIVGGGASPDMTMKKGGSTASSPAKAGAHKPTETGTTGVSINPEGVVNIDFN
jgi:hypothetical protein